MLISTTNSLNFSDSPWTEDTTEDHSTIGKSATGDLVVTIHPIFKDGTYQAQVTEANKRLILQVPNMYHTLEETLQELKDIASGKLTVFNWDPAKRAKELETILNRIHAQ